jgi:Flp pilus assembly protein TadD
MTVAGKLAETFDAALTHHQTGQLSDAERLYRRVLDADPGNPHALHLLGVIAHQQGEHAAAVELIRTAIARNPAAADYRNNLGNALQALGDRAGAILTVLGAGYRLRGP